MGGEPYEGLYRIMSKVVCGENGVLGEGTEILTRLLMRASATAMAMAKPSRVLVPLPSSSIIALHFASAAFCIQERIRLTCCACRCCAV